MSEREDRPEVIYIPVTGERTWTTVKINDLDVDYIRADLIDVIQAEEDEEITKS